LDWKCFGAERRSCSSSFSTLLTRADLDALLSELSFTTESSVVMMSDLNFG